MDSRFWSKVDKTGDCWVWTASRGAFGYGYFGVKQANGKYKIKKAHRVSWEYANGPIPVGACVLHKCDNPPCVNPEHLFLGSHKDNMRDCVDKGRKPGIPQYGESNGYAKLTEAKVKIIRYVGNRLSQQRLADALGVTQTNIGHVLRGNTWKGVGIIE